VVNITNFAAAIFVRTVEMPVCQSSPSRVQILCASGAH